MIHFRPLPVAGRPGRGSGEPPLTASLAAPGFSPLPNGDARDEKPDDRVQPPGTDESVSQEPDEHRSGHVGAEQVLLAFTRRRARPDSCPDALLRPAQHRHEDQARCSEDDPDHALFGPGAVDQSASRLVGDVRGQDEDGTATSFCARSSASWERVRQPGTARRSRYSRIPRWPNRDQSRSVRSIRRGFLKRPRPHPRFPCTRGWPRRATWPFVPLADRRATHGVRPEAKPWDQESTAGSRPAAASLSRIHPLSRARPTGREAAASVS